jgi:hypothetical protein
MMQLRIFSKLFSALLHPIIMPLVALYLGAYSDSLFELFINPARLRIVYFIVALTTIVFPALSFLFLYRAKEISNLQMTIRKERFKPILTTILYYCLGYYLLRKGELPGSVLSFFFGCILSLILAVIINVKYKISLHAIGISGALAYILALFYLHNHINVFILFGLILTTGIVITSRLSLRAHVEGEIYLGLLVGFLSIYFPVIYSIYL